MTYGELFDKIKEIEKAVEDVKAAALSLAHGGAPETVARKEEQLDYEQRWLDQLREEEIKL